MPSCRQSWRDNRLGLVPIRPLKLREAGRCFFNGGLIAYPTEAVYGLGCDPLDGDAVRRLLELKQRPVEKGLILIAADFSQLRPFLGELPRELMAPVLASWPGPATWLLPAAEHTPSWLTGNHDSLAVRVTAHPLAAALSLACRSPLVSTSANPTGRPPARTVLDVRRILPKGIDFILSGAVGPEKKPTPIRDALSGAEVRG